MKASEGLQKGPATKAGPYILTALLFRLRPPWRHSLAPSGKPPRSINTNNHFGTRSRCCNAEEVAFFLRERHLAAPSVNGLNG